ncbi:MAG: HAD family hydrolase [Deltaproteobacteria bacterium]|jgi:phosphoglycolate phosphatase
MKFKAVLFDLDGTLLDTIGDLTDSMNIALNHLGFPGHNAGACKMFVGDGVEMFAFRALPENDRHQAMVKKCASLMRQEYKKRWAKKTRPYEGIPELLNELTNRNLKMSILSNKPDDATKEMVTEILSKWSFHPVAGAQVSVPKKPDPTLAIQISQELQVSPERFLYLGDTGTDMRTARGAGMFAVGVLWGFRSAEELEHAGARVLVKHPRDVLALL